jgi:hypothetical protein
MEALATLVVWLALLDGIPQPGPAPTDGMRLPPHPTCKANLDLADAHLAWIHSVDTPTGVAEREMGNWRIDANYYRHVWSIIEEATDPATSDTCRTRALVRLRAMVGEEAWWGGHLPPPVPMGRFRRLD